MDPSSTDGRSGSAGSSATKPEDLELKAISSSSGSSTTRGSREPTGEAIPMNVLSRASESGSGRSTSSGPPLVGFASIWHRANQWWTRTRTRDKVIGGVAFLLILVLFIWAIVTLSKGEERHSATISSSTTSMQPESSEWSPEYSTLQPEQQTDGSTIESQELPTTKSERWSTSDQSKVTSPESTEPSSIEVLTEEPTVQSSEPTVGPTSTTQQPTSQPVELTSTPQSITSTKSPITSLLEYERDLDKTLNFNRDPCNDFFDFVCDKSPIKIPIADKAMFDLLLTVDLAMQHERNRTHKKYPMGVQIIVDLYFDCLGNGQVGHAKTLYKAGLDQETLPWKKDNCMKNIFMDHYLVFVRLYVDQLDGEVDSRAFISKNVEKAQELITHLKASFRTNIEQHVTWLDEHSRARVLRKFDRMSIAFGLPHVVFDDTFFDVLYNVKGNALPGATFPNTSYPYEERKKHFVDIKNSQLMLIESTHWHSLASNISLMRGSSLNAYYSVKGNNITIPIHWLRFPVFDPDFMAFYNFGALGTVIAHEMTHGFGKRFSNWDEHGQYNPGHMWTNASALHFYKQADCFVRQYGSIPLTPNIFVDGHLTLEENIADNGGVKVAYYALRSYIQSGHSVDHPLLHSPLKVNQFTPYQRFFIAYAQSMCEPPPRTIREWKNYGDKTHLPSLIRINKALCNFDLFAQAFSCPATSNMNCQHKCIMW